MVETGEPVAVISGRHKKKLLSRADAMLEAGDLGETFATFTNPDTGAPRDPDAVFFRFKAADGTVVTEEFGVDAAVIKLSVGSYQRNIDALAAGSWRYRWFATGNGQSSQSSGFTVKTPKTA